MRGATECAKRLKLYFSSLRSKLGKVGYPATSDPITQLILGVLSRDTPETKASEGLERLRGMVVDYNELRVIPALELSEVLADFADVRLKCEDISRALNKIFAREHTVSLDRALEMSKRDQVAYLEDVDGLDAYTRARIRLLGFRQHAIPLDEAMWALARREEIIAEKCELDEAQRFLERQISSDDGLEFVALLKKQAWTEFGAAVRSGKVERILSVPPDRTSRNMLQTVAGLADKEESSAEAEDEVEEAAPASTAKSTASSRKRSAKAPTKTDGAASKPKRARKGARPRAKAATKKAATAKRKTKTKPAKSAARKATKKAKSSSSGKKKATASTRKKSARKKAGKRASRG